MTAPEHPQQEPSPQPSQWSDAPAAAAGGPSGAPVVAPGGPSGVPVVAPGGFSGEPVAAPGGFSGVPVVAAGGPPSRGRGRALLIGGAVAAAVLAVVVVVAVAGVTWLMRDDSFDATTGDCLSGQTSDELKVVTCGDSGATFKVVGKIDSISQQDWQSKLDICQAYPTAQKSFWKGRKGGNGYALCLEPIGG